MSYPYKLGQHHRPITTSSAAAQQWFDRGLMWIDAGDPDEALADLEQANLLLEGYARTYGAFSIYALAQGDAETAAGWQARAMEAQRAWDAWVWRR